MQASNDTVELRMGALSPSIAEQLQSQGLGADEGTLAHWQKDADAIVRLAVRGLISPGESSRARKKLVKNVAKLVQPLQVTSTP